MMDKEKLKLIIRNLESLVDCLKSEVYSDVDSYKPQYEEVAPYIDDYDEVFYDGENDDFDDDLFEIIKSNKNYKISNNKSGDGL
jgi:hypothetical protein